MLKKGQLQRLAQTWELLHIPVDCTSNSGFSLGPGCLGTDILYRIQFKNVHLVPFEKKYNDWIFIKCNQVQLELIHCVFLSNDNEQTQLHKFAIQWYQIRQNAKKGLAPKAGPDLGTSANTCGLYIEVWLQLRPWLLWFRNRRKMHEMVLDRSSHEYKHTSNIHM